MNDPSPIQVTVDQILVQAAAHGVEITDHIREDARDFLKKQLYEAGLATFNRVVSTRSVTQKFSRKDLSARDITVYRGEAFNLVHLAPGGLTEVDPFGQPVLEDRHHQYCD